MSLTRAQYDEIFRTYNQRQLDNRHKLEIKLNEVYSKIPRIVEINDHIASLSISYAKKLLGDGSANLSPYKNLIKQLTKEKEELLLAGGFTKDYLETSYVCNDCKDTGYIGAEKCHCFKQEIVNFLYSQSNIRKILEIENFSTFSFQYYSDNQVNNITGSTPLHNIKKVVEICKNFIQNFNKPCQNLFFYGESGVGKSFLCNCIAKELIEQSYSVIYLSAIRLFEILADITFKNNHNGSGTHYNMKHLVECDLLIIDDLGTELTNSFTNSGLFNCINERCLNQKSVIISTNLSISELQKNYSERTFSRITSNYTLLKIYGDDIRVKKKLEG